MSYITVNVDVDVDIHDLKDEDLIEALDDKLQIYERRNTEKKKYLLSSIKELLEDHNQTTEEPLVFTDLPGSLHEYTVIQVLKKLAKKYTLEELEILLNK